VETSRVGSVVVGIAVPLVCIAAALFGHGVDDGPYFTGAYRDFQLLDPQTPQPHEFTFVRLIYNGRIPGYLKNWYTDYPAGDRHLIHILRRLTNIDIASQERAIPIDHPDLFLYPMVYSCEAGQMVLNDNEARVMREYLDRGGFWMIDDFWGTVEWASFAAVMHQILPGRPIVDIPRDHPIFHSAFDIDEILQVPNVAYAYCPEECPTWELDGRQPHVRGVFDANGRLAVLINFNTDLMDASEWSDDPKYPSRFSAYSYKIFANAVVYAMTH